MLKLEVNTDSAAFEDCVQETCADILRDIADELDRGSIEGIVKDCNGNPVGNWSLCLQ